MFTKKDKNKLHWYNQIDWCFYIMFITLLVIAPSICFACVAQINFIHSLIIITSGWSLLAMLIIWR